ncbi:MAG: hypothetical protein IJ856_00450 [Candidatus Methanomethylophilaceae archaeon]|nr:hypothetical protein [Candidatus Methanomethylophilaceae archaeon]
MRGIALTVSDILFQEGLDARIQLVKELASEFPCVTCICVRDDACDDSMLGDTLDRILGEWSKDIVVDGPYGWAGRDMEFCPEVAAVTVRSMEDLDTVVGHGGVPMPVGDVGFLTDASHAVGNGGMLCLEPTTMKDCLESCTVLSRSLGPKVGTAVRVWSGEYSVSVATVALVCGASAVLFDDVDRDGLECIQHLLRWRRHLV